MGFWLLKGGWWVSHETELWVRILFQDYLLRSNLIFNHINYNKILESDWQSIALISALLGQCNRTVRVMPK